MKRIAVIFAILLLTAFAAGAQTLRIGGKTVATERFRDISYACIESTGAIDVELTFDTPVTDCEISPLRKGIKPSCSGNTVTFRVPGPGKWVVGNGGRVSFFLLVDTPEKAPRGKVLHARKFPDLQTALDAASGSGKTLVIDPGTYESGTLRIGSDTDVYLCKGALLQALPDRKYFPADEGRLEADKVNRPESYSDNGEFMTFSRFILIEGENVRLRGRGTIDGSGTVLRSQGKPSNLIRVRNSRNVLIEGVVLRNPAAWNTHILHSDGVTLRNVKIINDPDVPNTDGIDPDSSTKVLVEDCFAYCSDDNVAVKSTGNSGLLKDVEDILIKDCVFLTKKSSLKIGTETKAHKMRNIRFCGNDVVRCDRAFAIYCNDGAAISDVLFEDNHVERNWPDNQRKLVHFKISKRHGRGRISKVTLRRCSALEPFPRQSEIKGLDADHRIVNVRFEDCKVVGEDVKTSFTSSEVRLTPVVYKDFRWSTLVCDLPCKVTVDCPEKVREAEVSPHSRGIKPSVKGNEVSFEVEEYGAYQLLANGKRIFLFVEKPAAAVSGVSVLDYPGVDAGGVKEVTKAVQKAIDDCAWKGRTLVFPAGTYLCRMLSLPSGAHIHLEKGAVIKADPSAWEHFDAKDNVKTKRFINIKDAKGVKVSGLGAIDGSGRELRDQFSDKARMRLVMAIASSDILFEDVILRDPGSWNTQILDCDNVTFRNVKVLNDFNISNTDGIDPDASRNVLIENSFAYCSDDNVAIKTTGYSGYLSDLDGVTVRGCVFITRKSSLKVGTETRGASMRNILFEDNDVLLSDRGMAIYVSDGAVVDNVTYRNNRFERYTEKGKMTGFELQVKGRNPESRIGKISNLTIENSSFEKPFPRKSAIISVPEGQVEVVFKGLSIEGKNITEASQADITIQGSKVKFE